MKLAIATATMALLLAPAAMAQDLTLNLSSRGEGGLLAVAVYRDAEAFRRSERPIASRTIPRTGTVTTVTFTGLAPDRYAVAAFHDTDANGRLTLWPIGLPKEAYGFSNDARGQFGPPRFDAASFPLGPSGTSVSFALR